MTVRVLVVDESVVARQSIVKALAEEPGIECAAATPGVGLARRKLNDIPPDVVVLDSARLERALNEIKDWDQTLPVVVFSQTDSRPASASARAAYGRPVGFLPKPFATAGDALSPEYLRLKLVPMLRRTARNGVSRPARKTRDHKPISVVVITVSTGGPEALEEVVSALPSQLPVPILIVQHMPARFTQLLAQRLDEHCELSVSEAAQGQEVVPGQIYLAPGGRHMVVARSQGRTVIHLTDGPAVNSCRPSGDVLLRSAVDVFGSGVLALVMTGMGFDGAQGCRQVQAAGGVVFAQDAASSTVSSMPGAVAGFADEVLALGDIGPRLAQLPSPDGGS